MSPADHALLNKVIYTSVFVPLLLCGLLIWFLIHYQKKRHQVALKQKEDELRISKLKLEKQTALQHERTRIAAEMHDDLGGGLTTIKFLGQKMLRKIDDVEQKTQLNKIVDNSQALVSNMSEIIWAMNAGFDTLDNLVAYCRRFASEYLADHNLKLTYVGLGAESGLEFSGEKRRHMFLVFKELLHNIVKHADASAVEINWHLTKEQIGLSIKDNGVGLHNDLAEVTESTGNGLRNLESRMKQLGGEISWASKNGCIVELNLPLSSLSAISQA